MIELELTIESTLHVQYQPGINVNISVMCAIMPCVARSACIILTITTDGTGKLVTTCGTHWRALQIGSSSVLIGSHDPPAKCPSLSNNCTNVVNWIGFGT